MLNILPFLTSLSQDVEKFNKMIRSEMEKPVLESFIQESKGLRKSPFFRWDFIQSDGVHGEHILPRRKGGWFISFGDISTVRDANYVNCN